MTLGTFSYKLIVTHAVNVLQVGKLYRWRWIIREIAIQLILWAVLTKNWGRCFPPNWGGEWEAPSGAGYEEGCPLSSRLGSPGSVVSSTAGPGQRKRILAYSEGHRTLLSALWCFEFVKQCFMSHLGRQLGHGGNHWGSRRTGPPNLDGPSTFYVAFWWIECDYVTNCTNLSRPV